MPSAASRVICAPGSPKRWSRLGWIGFVRPNNASRKPISVAGQLRGSRERAAHLGVELREGIETLLVRRVRREQTGQADSRCKRWREVEGVEVFRRAEVPRRNASHFAGHLHERRREKLWLSNQDCSGSVRSKLAISRKRANQ